MHTRIKHVLALVGLLAFVTLLVPGHAEGGTIPTPSGTGAVCVVNGKVQPTACAIGGGGITTVANGGTGAAMTCADGDVVQATSATALACRDHVNFGAVASVATTGKIRLPDANAAVLVGLNGVTDYEGIRYGGSANSTWTFGNGAEYNQQNGYDFRVAPSTGGSLYLGGYGTWTDSTSGVVADLAIASWYLTANFTTTSATATATNITWPVVNAEAYTLECYLTTQCSSTGGVKYSIGAPVGSTVEGWLDATTTSITTLTRQRFTAVNTLNGTATHTVATTPGPDVIRARVVSGGAGSITLKAASVTAGQTTTIFAGSFCNFRRAYAK